MQRGSLRKVSGGWGYRLDIGIDADSGGRRQVAQQGFATKREAQVALEDVIAKLRDGAVPRRTQMTVGEFLDQWLEGERVNLRQSTWYSYEVVVQRIKPHLGRTKLQGLTPAMVQHLYAVLLESGGNGGRPLAPKTVRNTHVVLRRALADATRLELVHRNAAASAKPPKASRPDQQTWTSDDLRDFMEATRDDRMYPVWVLLATTGMRRGEVVGLRWRDVDLDAGQIAISHSITTAGSATLVAGPPKTPRSRRNIYLDDATIRILRAHRTAQKAERLAAGPAWDGEMKLVFCDELGSTLHPDRVSVDFARWSATIDVPKIRLHDLRHTYATLALKAGMHPKLVSERLGHATVGITLDLYSHVTPSIARQAASVVSSQFLD
jgi:integrase